VKIVLSVALIVATAVVGLGSWFLSPAPPRPQDEVAALTYTSDDMARLRAEHHLGADVVLVSPEQISRAVLDDTTVAHLVAFPGDPHSRAAFAYLRSTASPTGAGYLAWLAARGFPKPALRLVAVGAGAILPGHDHRPRVDWLTSASLVRIA
jgi:hypothetical protein